MYRKTLKRGLVALMGREHWDLLMGETLSGLWMDDLEALFELVFGWNPRHLAPAEYRPSPTRSRRRRPL